MSVESFLDTNILVYAAAGHGREEAKRRRAVDLIQSENFGLSTEVLQEFFVCVTRKIDVPLSTEKALAWIEKFESFPCMGTDVPMVKLAIENSARFQISYGDGAIIAAAEAMRVKTLYSEDLNSGQLYGSVRVLNPFLKR